jgi:hypothetical protein
VERRIEAAYGTEKMRGKIEAVYGMEKMRGKIEAAYHRKKMQTRVKINGRIGERDKDRRRGT